MPSLIPGLPTNDQVNEVQADEPAESRNHSKSISRSRRVRQRTGLSNSAMYEAIQRGEFPAPIRIGARAVGWLDHEIDAWIEARIAASRQSKA